MTKKKIEITKRDIELFKYLFENKIATNEQIRIDVFDNSSKQVAHRRLNKLIAAKYIGSKYLKTKGNRLIYFLNGKTVNQFIGSKKELHSIHKSSYCPYHDLTLVTIRRVIKDSQTVEKYYTENVLSSGVCDANEEIKSIREINPDAILRAKLNDNKFYLPLEYERSQKVMNRYDTLMRGYYSNNLIQAVIYICENEQIKKQVQKSERKFVNDNQYKFFYTTIDSINDGNSKLIFYDQANSPLLL